MRVHAVALSVEYIGASTDVRCETHYRFVQAQTDEAAYDLAERLAACMTTDEGGGYIACEAMQVGGVRGEFPDLVTVLKVTDVPGVPEDDTEVVDQETTECCVCSADLAHRAAGFVCDTCGRLYCNYHVDAEMRGTDVCPHCR